MLKNIFSILMLSLIITGCSLSDKVKLNTKEFKSIGGEVEFIYPENWFVTDKSMGPGVVWLVVSDTEFKVLEGNHWPFINIYVFNTDETEFIDNQLQKLSEINLNKEINKSNAVINNISFDKHITDELSDETLKGRVVNYIFNNADLTIVIETMETESFQMEIETIINSIKI